MNIFSFIFILLITFPLFARELEISGRVQGVIENQSKNTDLYLRRVRVNTLFHLTEDKSIYFDIRNDNVDRDKRSNDGFQLGDAYYKWKTPHLFFNNLTLFRAKVDVSYGQTSSSKHLFQPERTLVSEYAANFIIHNRRATNIQVNGNIRMLAYQLVVADGVQADKLTDYDENKAKEIETQSLSYGAKLRYYFISDAKENKVQETFYGKRNTFSVGLGHFRNDRIRFIYFNDEKNLKRALTNIELSYAHNSLRILSEYFHFSGDLRNLESNNQGSAYGHYIQSEYVLNTYNKKWAPFFLYQVFTRNSHRISGSGVGLNFYPEDASFRYGVAYNKIEGQEKVSLYTFLDF